MINYEFNNIKNTMALLAHALPACNLLNFILCVCVIMYRISYNYFLIIIFFLQWLDINFKKYIIEYPIIVGHPVYIYLLAHMFVWVLIYV